MYLLDDHGHRVEVRYDCAEPEGNERVKGTGETQHEMMLVLVGQCPWCGEEID